MPWQYTAAYVRVLYASHDIIHGHSVKCRPTQATIPCLDMIDVSLSLSVVNSHRNLNVAKIGSWMDLANDLIINPVKLSVYQLTGTWQFRPFAHFICLACFDIARLAWQWLWSWTQSCCGSSPCVSVSHWRILIVFFVTRMHNERWMNYPTHSN